MSPDRATAAEGPEIPGLTFQRRLGSGGYSDVYLYEQASPRRAVAVKVLRAGRIDATELAQFAAEAETMATLADHPYIVQVFATGTLPDGQPYLVMHYYPGQSLAERVVANRYSVGDVLRIGIKIASAVETAHRAGIIHRDVKPANILVSPYGEPGLTDFGIARHAADADTDDDNVGVSIPWAPPEVLTGESSGSVQSDVYSLAATVWHLLAGRSPFEVPGGDNSQAALVKRILRTNAPRTGRPDVPPSLEMLLAQSMHRVVTNRPRTALEFARGLQAVEHEQRLARTDILVAGLGQARGATGERPDDEYSPTGMRSSAYSSDPSDGASLSGWSGAQPPGFGRPGSSGPVAGQHPSGTSGHLNSGPPPTAARPARPVMPAGLPPAPPSAVTPSSVIPGGAQQAESRRDQVRGVPMTPPQYVAPTTASEPSARERQYPDRAGTPETLLRPTIAASGERAESPSVGSGRRWIVLSTAAAAVVAAIVVVAGSGNDSKTPVSPLSVTPTADPNLPSFGDTDAPSVSVGQAVDGMVTFTFAAPAGAAGGSFGWQADNGQADPRTSANSVQLPTGTCITATYIFADGHSSGVSAKTCG